MKCTPVVRCLCYQCPTPYHPHPPTEGAKTGEDVDSREGADYGEWEDSGEGVDSCMGANSVVGENSEKRV